LEDSYGVGIVLFDFAELFVLFKLVSAATLGFKLFSGAILATVTFSPLPLPLLYL
jgi:hypothetical protein